LGLDAAARLTLSGRFGEGAEVDDRQRDGRGGGDRLIRLATDLGEGRAQRLVPADDFAQRGGERRDVEIATQTDRGRHAVGRGTDVQAVEKPQPLLSEREGRPFAALTSDERR